MAVKLMITNARINYAFGLFKASAMEEGQTKKYSADFLLTDESVVFEVDPVDSKKRTKTTLKAAELKVANDAWKGKGQAMLDSLEGSKKAIRNGDAKLDKSGNPIEHYVGRTYVSAKNQLRPRVINGRREEVSEDDGAIYSGCVVNVMLELYPITEAKKKGVFASLLGVQFVRDDERFSGGGVAKADDFDVLEESVDDLA